MNYDKEMMDFLLFGIVSAFKDYRLCYELNKVLDLNLERTTEHTIEIGRNNLQVKFERFQYENEYNQCFTFISNRHEQRLLLPEIARIDFLLMIHPAESIRPDDYIKMIKEIALVNAAFVLSPMELKSRQNLL